MKKEYFEQLSIIEKNSIVTGQGKSIATRSYYNQELTLYKVHDFLVEVFYHSYLNEITEVRVVSDIKTLSLYASDIDLSGLDL